MYLYPPDPLPFPLLASLWASASAPRGRVARELQVLGERLVGGGCGRPEFQICRVQPGVTGGSLQRLRIVEQFA